MHAFKKKMMMIVSI